MRIGMTNQKGGVAKTTDTIHVAGALAERGHDVLAVDVDPQGYLTHRLGHQDAYRSEPPSFYDALDEPTETNPSNLIVEAEEFSLLPANIDMFRLEQDLIASGWRPRERLDMVLDRLGSWDYIIVDAPPSLGPLNDNVIIATQNLLIPCEAESTSKLALEHLLRQVETIEQRYEIDVSERGILVSNIDYPLDSEQKRMLEWYRETFDGRCPVWEVRNRAAIKRAMDNLNASVFASDEECDQQGVFLEIAEHLESIND